MRGFATLVLAFFLSWLLAGALQVQLGVLFKADLELVMGMLALMVMTFATTLLLGIALAGARTVRGVDRTAVWLVTFTLAAGLAMLAFEPITRGKLTITRSELALAAEIVAPVLLMIVIQWWLIRRRWLKAMQASQGTPA